MPHPHSASNHEQVVDTMIELTRLSHLHRAIVAGSDSLELYLALRRRGFARVSTPETCRIARGHHAVGLITGQNSLAATEAALTQISIAVDAAQCGPCATVDAAAARKAFIGGSNALAAIPGTGGRRCAHVGRPCHDSCRTGRMRLACGVADGRWLSLRALSGFGRVVCLIRAPQIITGGYPQTMATVQGD